uniref:Uncharacterized protein n=1 Tax=Arion vulgaris TaxID=1028688 RepID=A0A0B7A775_9EUPU
MEANVIKYRTTITGRIPLNVLQSNQVFECSATSRLGDKHTVGLPFKVKVYDPKIVCNNSEAHVGKRYPMLVCTVDYEGLSIKSFKYELGSRDAVQEGTQNDEFVEVERKQISDTKAIVTLNLYKAKKWHFDTEFYLVVEHTDGHSTRESVRLFETPGGNGSSRFSGASLVTLIISLWCAHQLFR